MSAQAPDAAALFEAAMSHMARYAATEASLARILARRIDRWGQNQPEDADPEALIHLIRNAKAEIPAIIAKLKALGVLNDAAFAASRARRLTRSGRSHRATLAHLAAKGVQNPTLPENPADELAAACVYLRRRRAGPYGDAPRVKILAAMARGGFAHNIACQALALTREEADHKIAMLASDL